MKINYLKESIIMTIRMMADIVKGTEYSEIHYSYNKLIECSLDNLEGIRDRFIIEYNQFINQKR